MRTLAHSSTVRAQILRQFLDLWPYMFIGISLAGLAYEIWTSAR